jgi:hypothetical protein
LLLKEVDCFRPPLGEQGFAAVRPSLLSGLLFSFQRPSDSPLQWIQPTAVSPYSALPRPRCFAFAALLFYFQPLTAVKLFSLDFS